MNSRITHFVDQSVLKLLKAQHNPFGVQSSDIQKSSRELVQSIAKVEFLPEWSPFIKRFHQIQQLYPAMYAHRTDYLWKWVQAGFEITSLKNPPNTLSHSLKCRSFIIVVLIDDICDVAQNENDFEKCVAILDGVTPDKGCDLYRLIYDVWHSVQHDIKKTPNYSSLKHELDDGYKRLIESFRYGLSISNCQTVDWDTYIEITQDASHVYLAGLMDLLYIPNLSISQISQFKTVFLQTQKMAQIGNWITTWKREIKQRDFSSGVIVYALENNWINRDALENMDSETLIRHIKQCPSEQYLLDMWQKTRMDVVQLSNQIKSPLLDGYVDSFSVIASMQLAASGLI